jgi:hypothetical protein
MSPATKRISVSIAINLLNQLPTGCRKNQKERNYSKELINNQIRKFY